VRLGVGAVLGLASLSLAATALHGSFGRPIWIDEFVHFALGSHSSTAEALDTIYKTTVTLSHGQTGVYMLLDYWLMQLFGANAVALRLPSLLSTLLLFWAATTLLRVRGFGPGWQALAVLALFANTTLMYFAGEARPYMPLAAASLGTVAYYLAPPAERPRRTLRALGVVSIVWGAVVHPYFSLYWLPLFLFSYGLAVAEGTRAPGFRSLLAHVNLPLSAVGVGLYFGVGAVTWLRGGPAFTFDPFEWVKRDRLVYEFVSVSHGNFLPWSLLPWSPDTLLAVFAAIPIAYLLVPRCVRARVRALVFPALLLALSLALAILIGWFSYRRSYWILPRQWVASMALAAVATVWVWAEIGRALGRVHRALGFTVLVVTFGLLLPQAHLVFVERSRSVSAYLAERSGPTGDPPPPETAPPPTDNLGWVDLANANVRAGGPVWPVFRRYYAR
jgi:hypothetical protein